MINILSTPDMFWLTNNHFQGAVKILKIVRITERNVHGTYIWIHGCATQCPIMQRVWVKRISSFQLIPANFRYWNTY